MKIDVQAVLSDLEAKGLPLAKEVLIVVVDSVVKSFQGQAAAQSADPVAAVLSVVLAALTPAIDAELAVLLPGAAKV